MMGHTMGLRFGCTMVLASTMLVQFAISVSQNGCADCGPIAAETSASFESSSVSAARLSEMEKESLRTADGEGCQSVREATAWNSQGLLQIGTMSSQREDLSQRDEQLERSGPGHNEQKVLFIMHDSHVGSAAEAALPLPLGVYFPLLVSLREALGDEGVEVVLSRRGEEDATLSRIHRATAGQDTQGAAAPRVWLMSLGWWQWSDETNNFLRSASTLGARLVLYQSEPGNPILRDLPMMAANLGAAEVWDYSLRNLDHYQTRLPPGVISRYVPPGYARILDFGIDEGSADQNQSAVFFLGNWRWRPEDVRQMYEAAIGSRLTFGDAEAWTPEDYKPLLTKYPFQLNIHHNQTLGQSDRPMEAFRMALLLSNKACVISSPVHPDDQVIWQQFVKFVQPEDTGETVRDLLQQSLLQCRMDHYQRFRAEGSMANIVRKSGLLDALRGPQILMQKSSQAQKTSSRSAFVPTQGFVGSLSAALDEVCTEDYYQPSDFEAQFHTNALAWTRDEKELCEKLGQPAKQWMDQNKAGRLTDASVFSRLCKKGHAVQLIEPLAGILRDPRFLCPGFEPSLEFSIEWLVLADDKVLPRPDSKRLFFDAGGSHFMDAMHFFTSAYQQRGVLFDHAFVWEAEKQGQEAYWSGVPVEVRQFWEPRVTFYDGVPVSAEPGDQNNPVERIYELCGPDDFCAFKLDIDTPSVELAIVQQLISSPKKTAKSLNELFFEHHVHGLMQKYGWAGAGPGINGTFLDSYDLFSKLRRIGVRAHSWI
ncbi:unnamed protein product [Polarella glacialis]|uniref:Protein xylosyltransferase n=1 Tax=Polarella glacialis TaxID=89957 RepID=A0A813GZP1_POLGL|nr:unnamed protein product [Polarella glacialis]